MVDDGSSDDTGKILGRFLAIGSATSLRPIRVSVWHGIRESRKRGASGSRFLDSDDLWEKDKLEWQFKALERFGPECGACYTDTRFFNHPETRTMFQIVEKEYRHEETMGVNREVLERLVRPGGAGMVVCLSSLRGAHRGGEENGGIRSQAAV